MSEQRESEVALGFDPATLQGDGHVIFIGRVHSPWKERENCPKNMTAARETAQPASIELDAAYRDGLLQLDGFSHIIILTWLDRAKRNLIVQKPRHAPEPKGVFALRSPVRPNPIGMHVVRLTNIDMEKGLLALEAIDVLDGTPVIDIKPYFASADSIPDASRPGKV